MATFLVVTPLGASLMSPKNPAVEKKFSILSTFSLHFLSVNCNYSFTYCNCNILVLPQHSTIHFRYRIRTYLRFICVLHMNFVFIYNKSLTCNCWEINNNASLIQYRDFCRFIILTHLLFPFQVFRWNDAVV